MLNKLKLMALGIMLVTGCQEKRPPRDIDRSFYYWKSFFKLDRPTETLLHHLNVKRLYVKFFDVSWNSQTKQPMPMAIVRFPPPPIDLKGLEIVPVIFITNDCIEKMGATQIYTTAGKIVGLIQQICTSNILPVISEIQLDCDWNATTRSKYFELLRSIRLLTASEKKKLSATIRLYQYKYAMKTGVPPVDRGLLMCYNMGNLKNISTRNSILTAEEVKKYTAGSPAYPMPLDVALPLFGWKVLFRNRTYRGLISELPTSALLKNPAVNVSGNRYTMLRDTSLGGYDLKAGDILRDEQVAFDEIIKAVSYLLPSLKSQHLTVSLYHLDSLTLSKYSLHELETIFDHLR